MLSATSMTKQVAHMYVPHMTGINLHAPVVSLYILVCTLLGMLTHTCRPRAAVSEGLSEGGPEALWTLGLQVGVSRIRNPSTDPEQ